MASPRSVFVALAALLLFSRSNAAQDTFSKEEILGLLHFIETGGQK